MCFASLGVAGLLFSVTLLCLDLCSSLLLPSLLPSKNLLPPAPVLQSLSLLTTPIQMDSPSKLLTVPLVPFSQHLTNTLSLPLDLSSAFPWNAVCLSSNDLLYSLCLSAPVTLPPGSFPDFSCTQPGLGAYVCSHGIRGNLSMAFPASLPY